MTHPHLEDVSKRFDEKFPRNNDVYSGISKKIDAIFNQLALEQNLRRDAYKAFLLSEITTAYDQGREDGEKIFITDSELYSKGYEEGEAKGRTDEAMGCETHVQAALTQEREKVTKILNDDIVNVKEDFDPDLVYYQDPVAMGIKKGLKLAIEIVNKTK